MSRKRRREQPSVDVQAVEIYEDLANESEEIRLKAAQALLSRISNEKSPSHGELDKILKRLFRGLCSGRKAARLGFSVALTEFLLQHAEPTQSSDDGLAHLTMVEIVDVLEKQTHLGGSVAGQEERDHHFGRLFGAEAVIKSRVLISSDSIEQWERVIGLVYELAMKKAWLREECGWVLREALLLLKPCANVFKHAQIVIDKLSASGLAKTPEGLALWVTAQFIYPDIQLPKHVWHHEDPLHRRERSNLARTLKEIYHRDGIKDTTKQTAEKGMWSSRIHFAWDVVFEALLDSSQNALKRLKFPDLWTEAVDDGLFSMSSSNERKYWGFLLFDKYIEVLPHSTIGVLFGKNFVRCLTNQLASHERYLHRMAEKVLRSIHVRASREPSLAGLFIEKLTIDNGYHNFDVITKTKTIEKLLREANLEALLEIVPRLSQVILRPHTQDEKTAAVARQTIADQLVSAIRSRDYPSSNNPAFSQHRNCISLIIATFVKYAYASNGPIPDTSENSPIPPISESTREMFKSRINSSLGHLMAKAPDPAFHPYNTLCDVRSQIENNTESSSILQSDPEIAKAIGRAWRILEKIHGKEEVAAGTKKDHLQAFKLLFTMTLLQVYNADPDAFTMVDELEDCYKALVKRNKSENQGEGSEILIEIILSYVSKPSLMFKRVAEQVFSVCTPLLTENGLKCMIKVLETKESISGQEEIFDKDDEAMEDVTSGSGMSDVEEIPAQAEGSVKSDDVGDISDVSENSRFSDNEEADDEPLQGEEDAELAAFDAKLAQALGTKRADQALEDGDDSESSDEDMDDDQMEALDIHLEKVFSERKKMTNKKTERKQAKETIIIFKSRVLELLEIYIKDQYLGTLSLDLILPLLGLIRATTSKQVAEKAGNLVREYCKLYKLKDTITAGKAFSAEAVTGLLKAVHEAAAREGSNAYSNACSQASLLLAKVAITNGGNVSQIVDCYASTQKTFMTDPACKIKTSFFTEWLNWCTSARKNLPS